MGGPENFRVGVVGVWIQMFQDVLERTELTSISPWIYMFILEPILLASGSLNTMPQFFISRVHLQNVPS